MYLRDLLILILVTIISFLGVRLFRIWSFRRSIIDIPNERSSHSVPTPRGGGLVIAAICLVFYLIYGIWIGGTYSWGYFLGAVLIVLISWIDDLYSIRFEWRFLVHICAALLLVLGSGYLSAFERVTGTSDALWTFASFGLIIFSVVWLINLYNFMDGIDGIAGFQAVVAGIGFYVMASCLDLDSTRLYVLVLIGSCVGFLLQNWQPARIFMGDVGSAFIGFTFAAIPMIGIIDRPGTGGFYIIVSIFFLWAFVFDTVFTLLLRIFGRERIWEAHRQHLYQKMVIGGWSHANVALIYGAACALMTTATILTVNVSGNFVILLVFCTIAVSIALTMLAYRKKTLT